MFRDIQIVIIMKFVIVSSVGIKRVDCIGFSQHLFLLNWLHISCELSTKETADTKCQVLFSRKN